MSNNELNLSPPGSSASRSNNELNSSPPGPSASRSNNELNASRSPNQIMSRSYGALNRLPASGNGSPSNRLSHSLGAPADIPVERKAEIIKKHLATSDFARSVDSASPSAFNDPYDLYSTSHKLPGGEATYEVHKWHKDVESQPMKRTRSQSLYAPRPVSIDPHLREPGGFRRHYISMRAREEGKEPNFLTRNFIDFLAMYGHFAGEELSDDEDGFDHVSREETPLIPSGTPPPTASVSKVVFLLLKSFVGTGVILLPRAFLNGGMVFSFVVLIAIAAISLFAFLLLVETRLVIQESFGGIGGALYGPWMKAAVLTSITISQLGFVCAYMIFVAKNLQSFGEHVFGRTLNLQWYIWGQVFLFVPLAMIRRISRLSGSALVADIFILFGLLYLYYYDIFKLSTDGVADIVDFNWRTFSLFIGTAVFTFEGIGLIIPIHEAMKEPEKFPKVLTGVMLFLAVIFVSIGALSYAAFGSKVEPVVILNLPNDDPVVLSVQLLYALAIALSIPLQLFPALRIMEQPLFSRSGKDYLMVKWQKNTFRLMIVCVCAYIATGGAQNLDKFVSLIGAFACVPLCFLYPPLFHLKAVARTVTAKLLDIGVLMFGAFAMIYTTYMSLSMWHEK